MRPQTVLYSFIGLLLLSASSLSADEVSENRLRQDPVESDEKPQQSPAIPASDKPVAESAETGKGKGFSQSEQEQVDDMQAEFERVRENSWDDRYRY